MRGEYGLTAFERASAFSARVLSQPPVRRSHQTRRLRRCASPTFFERAYLETHVSGLLLLPSSPAWPRRRRRRASWPEIWPRGRTPPCAGAGFALTAGVAWSPGRSFSLAGTRLAAPDAGVCARLPGCNRRVFTLTKNDPSRLLRVLYSTEGKERNGIGAPFLFYRD